MTPTYLPEEFPGLKALQAAGKTTREHVEALSDDELKAIDGIGPKTFSDIRAYDWGDGDSASDAGTADTPAGTARSADETPVKVGTLQGKKGTVTQTIDAK